MRWLMLAVAMVGCTSSSCVCDAKGGSLVLAVPPVWLDMLTIRSCQVFCDAAMGRRRE